MITAKPMCFKCKHMFERDNEHWFKCQAFPNGIPDEIFYGMHDHRKKYPGDNGIRFEFGSLNENAEKVLEKASTEVLKTWDDWSKFRKPKYEPANEKSVSACRKYAERGILKPGCARAIMLADKLYEPGRDDSSYIPPEPINPQNLVSSIKEKRDKEQQKQFAQNSMDALFDRCEFFRDSLGRVVITNWMALTPEDKQTLSSMFDEKGVLKDDQHRAFEDRLKDYNSRRMSRGLPSKNVG